MMHISVWHHDLSDVYLRQMTQLGAEYIDFGNADAFPGVKEQGYPDLDAVIATRRRIRSWGLDINRVTLPTISERFMRSEPEGERDVENACRALEVFAQAGIPIARQRFAGDASPSLTSPYRSLHRGGYTSRGEYAHQATSDLRTREEIERWWERFCEVYARLVPVAEEHNIQLAIHPSDTPYPGTPFDSLGLQRVLDAFPSRNVGLLYCVGTRAEAGGSSLVLDEINHFGRKGRIMTVHFRNVRGSLATTGGFEEVLLDDGDMNMFRVLLELQKAGFSGCLNPDHIPHLEGDGGGAGLGLAYSVGYIKALLAALAVVS